MSACNKPEIIENTNEIDPNDNASAIVELGTEKSGRRKADRLTASDNDNNNCLGVSNISIAVDAIASAVSTGEQFAEPMSVPNSSPDESDAWVDGSSHVSPAGGATAAARGDQQADDGGEVLWDFYSQKIGGRAEQQETAPPAEMEEEEEEEEKNVARRSPALSLQNPALDEDTVLRAQSEATEDQ